MCLIVWGGVVGGVVGVCVCEHVFVCVCVCTVYACVSCSV